MISNRPENGSSVPESVASISRPSVERGRRWFSLKRTLLGIAAGAIGIPATAFGIGIGINYLAGGLSNVQSSDIPDLIRVSISQAVTGAVVGGVMSLRGRQVR